MTGSAMGMVRKRLVFQIYGYQHTTPDRFHHRFCRDLAVFSNTWSVRTELKPAWIGPDGAGWTVRVNGPGWETQTDYRIIRLDDLIAQRHEQPLYVRLMQGYGALFDFVLHGAFIRYLRVHWPYAVFAAYPFVVTLFVLLTAIFAGQIFTNVAGIPAGLTLGIIAFVGLFWLVGQKLFLFMLLEDWAFASVLVRHLEPEINSRLDQARDVIAACLAESAADEILLIGHSLGAVLVLHLASKLLEAEMPPVRIAVLTIGSSLLKIGLHSRARAIRAATASVAAAHDPVWVDYQSGLDIMNFHGVEPVAAMGIRAPHPAIVRTAPFSRMLDPEAYRRLRFNFFRTHNQFVHAGTQRCAYDYFMFACGPFPFTDLATARYGAIVRIANDGSIVTAVTS